MARCGPIWSFLSWATKAKPLPGAITPDQFFKAVYRFAYPLGYLSNQYFVRQLEAELLVGLELDLVKELVDGALVRKNRFFCGVALHLEAQIDG